MTRSNTWSSILAGVFLAVAIQVLFLLLGQAVAQSTGDRALGAGYAIWSVLVALVALFVGSAFAGRLAGAESPGGALIGVMTWAVDLTVMSLAWFGTGQGVVGTSSTSWGLFFGALLSLGAAVLGGITGAKSLHGTRPFATRRTPINNTMPTSPRSPTPI